MPKIYMKDGPAQGKHYDYPHPVPDQVVITEVTGDHLKYHDYNKTYSNHFVHSQRCGCYDEYPREIKDLDK